MLSFTTCQMCGKEFIKRPGSIYKCSFAGKTHQFCSYTCYQQAKKVKEQVQASSHEIIYSRFRQEIRKQKKEESVSV